jgi:hypothetical protein
MTFSKINGLMWVKKLAQLLKFCTFAIFLLRLYGEIVHVIRFVECNYILRSIFAIF